MSKIVAGIIVAAGLAAPALAQTTALNTAAWDVDVRILVDGDPSSPYTGSGVEILPGVTAGTFRVGLTLQARANVAAGFFNGGIGRLQGIIPSAGSPVTFSHNAGAGSRLVAGDIGSGFNTVSAPPPSSPSPNGGTGFEASAGNAAGVFGSIFRGGLATGQNFGVTNASGFIVGNPAIGSGSTLGQFNAISAISSAGQTNPVPNFATSATEVSTSPFQSIYRFVFETTNLSLSQVQVDFIGVFNRIFGIAAGVGAITTGGAPIAAGAVAAGTDPSQNTPFLPAAFSGPTSSGSRIGGASVSFAIPTPGAAALLGLGGLVAARRRR